MSLTTTEQSFSQLHSWLQAQFLLKVAFWDLFQLENGCHEKIFGCTPLPQKYCRNIGIKTSHNVNNFLNHLIFCYHTSQCKVEGLSWMLHALQIEIYLNEISSTWSLLMHIWELPNGLFAFVCMVTWPRIDKFLTFFFSKFFFFSNLLVTNWPLLP